MGKLNDILSFLNEKKDSGITNYAVPKRWMPDNYVGNVKLKGRKFFVNPYEYFAGIIENITQSVNSVNDYSKPLSFIKNENTPDWIRKSIVYSAHVRMTSAYIHDENNIFLPIDGNGFTQSGTFLKMTALIPYLKKMGINCIYLLPITQSSSEYKKGEVGSPYSVKDFFKIEKDYHDTILEDKFDADDEFGAFVEACHIMNIRVMLDFVPRTSARDNRMILDHPEWFYWIDSRELGSYKPPYIPEMKFEQPTVENLGILYNSEPVKEHLKKFRFDPKTENPEKWAAFVEKNYNNPDFLTELIKEFKVITVPGFSDWINDPQPTWDDITFLRLYMSHPDAAIQYIPENQPPYVLFDVVKSSNFPGKEKNFPLWEKIADIMPFYQRTYGIDGARLDMGHALPKELEHMIIEKAKKFDPSFVIIAEELSMDNFQKAKNSGYDGILGNSWWSEPRIPEGWFKKFTLKMMPELTLPCFATSETPDSPRAVTRKLREHFSKISAVVNTFMPNGITVINSGYEIFESQPMNTGLDFENPMQEKFDNLPPNDQFYGKLAFFDWYVLHWDTDHHMVKLLELLGNVKNEVSDLVADTANLRIYDYSDTSFALFYWNGKKGIVIPVNLNNEYPYNYEIDLGFYTWRGDHKVKTVIENFRRGESNWEIHDGKLRVSLNPTEARVYIIE